MHRMSGPEGTAALYDEDYFRRFYDPLQGLPYERAEPWISFFGRIADRIVRDIAPRTVLDAGCAMGLLVEALRDRGVEAYGVDISEYAIANVREDIRPYCELRSITEPLPRDYDLVVTIETFEHLRPADAERAVDNVCAHAGDVLFSSTPDHQREPTHFNVRPHEYWAELFARNGLYRDADYDAHTYVSAWAVRYRRSAELPRVIAAYERLSWRLQHEAAELRSAVNEARAEIVHIEELEARVRRAEDELAALRDSSAYRLAVRGRTLARRLLPDGSRRGRLFGWAIRGAARGPARTPEAAATVGDEPPAPA